MGDGIGVLTMAILATGRKKIEIDVVGERRPHIVQLVGDNLHIGEGRLEIHSHVAIVEGGETVDKAIPIRHIHETKLTPEILAFTYNGVTGQQILNGFAMMVEMVWQNQINENGEFTE
jgi:hypothetical protein